MYLPDNRLKMMKVMDDVAKDLVAEMGPEYESLDDAIGAVLASMANFVFNSAVALYGFEHAVELWDRMKEAGAQYSGAIATGAN